MSIPVDTGLDALIEVLADRTAAKLAERLTVPSTPPNTPWINVEKAAEYLGNAPISRIYDLVQTGKLTPQRDGRRLLFHRDDLDGYLRDQS